MKKYTVALDQKREEIFGKICAGQSFEDWVHRVLDTQAPDANSMSADGEALTTEDHVWNMAEELRELDLNESRLLVEDEFYVIEVQKTSEDERLLKVVRKVTEEHKEDTTPYHPN